MRHLISLKDQSKDDILEMLPLYILTAVVILLLGAGAYWYLGGGRKPTPRPIPAKGLFPAPATGEPQNPPMRFWG